MNDADSKRLFALIENLGKRFEGVEQRLTAVEQRLGSVEGSQNAVVTHLDAVRHATFGLARKLLPDSECAELGIPPKDSNNRRRDSRPDKAPVDAT